MLGLIISMFDMLWGVFKRSVKYKVRSTSLYYYRYFITSVIERPLFDMGLPHRLLPSYLDSKRLASIENPWFYTGLPSITLVDFLRCGCRSVEREIKTLTEIKVCFCKLIYKNKVSKETDLFCFLFCKFVFCVLINNLQFNYTSFELRQGVNLKSHCLTP